MSEIAAQQERIAILEAESQCSELLLSTIAQVANLLLRSPDYRVVLPDVVRLLGEAVGSDRCTFVRSTTETGSGRILCRRLAGWSSEGTLDSVIANLEHELVEDDYLRIEGDLLTVHKRLEQGEIINFIVDELPETFRHLRCLCELQGTTSKLVVPIFVQSAYWGRVYFDNCGEPRLFDEAKISILKIAADSITAAIERQDKEDELLRIEQARSQELERHNAELQQAVEQVVLQKDFLGRKLLGKEASYAATPKSWWRKEICPIKSPFSST